MEQINEFAVKFYAQYSDTENIDIMPDADFRQVGSWDSLTGMAVLVMIQDDYGVDIPIEKFRELKTIKDVYNYVLVNKTK
jgi:acyl carrier protein